jgi:hypothetical protein
MSNATEDAELNGFIPYGDRKQPFFRRPRVLRTLVILGLVGLVVPGILTTLSVNRGTAEQVCALYVAALDRSASGSRVSFELLGEGGVGWKCYPIDSSRGEYLMAPLGIFPSFPSIKPSGIDS